MEWRRVKNIIILILLLVNSFLLVLVGIRRGEVLRYERSAMDQAVQILEENGIRVSADSVAPVGELTAQTVERSVSGEEGLVCALLDETVTGQNQGGGLYSFEGDRGTVWFRAGGSLSAELKKDARWRTDSPSAHAAQLLNGMKIESQLLWEDLNGESGTVTFRQLWQGVPLFACQVTFTYEDGYLTALSGNLIPADGGTEETGKLLELPTALLRFLDQISASGDICSEVVSMEPGYRMTQSFSSSLRLNPVWLISSNTAEYYMDASTGVLSRVNGES